MVWFLEVDLSGSGILIFGGVIAGGSVFLVMSIEAAMPVVSMAMMRKREVRMGTW